MLQKKPAAGAELYCLPRRGRSYSCMHFEKHSSCALKRNRAAPPIPDLSQIFPKPNPNIIPIIKKASCVFYWRSHISPYFYPCCHGANEAREIRTPNLLIWSQTRCRCAIAPCFDMRKPLSESCRRQAQDAMWASRPRAVVLLDDACQRWSQIPWVEC